MFSYRKFPCNVVILPRSLLLMCLDLAAFICLWTFLRFLPAACLLLTWTFIWFIKRLASSSCLALSHHAHGLWLRRRLRSDSPSRLSLACPSRVPLPAGRPGPGPAFPRLLLLGLRLWQPDRPLLCISVSLAIRLFSLAAGARALGRRGPASPTGPAAAGAADTPSLESASKRWTAPPWLQR